MDNGVVELLKVSSLLVVKIIGSYVVVFIQARFFSWYVYNNMKKNSSTELPDIDVKDNSNAGKRRATSTPVMLVNTGSDTLTIEHDNRFAYYKRSILDVRKIYRSYILGTVVPLSIVALSAAIALLGLPAGVVSVAYPVLLIVFLGFLFLPVYHRLKLKDPAINNNVLLILRVFGSKKNTVFLFNYIASFWRSIGSVVTIMDPVLARFEFRLFYSPENPSLKMTRNVLPMAVPWILTVFNVYKYSLALGVVLNIVLILLLSFVALYFFTRGMFIKNSKQLLDAVSDEKKFKLSFFGSFKTIRLYCFDNIWRRALHAVACKSRAILMDLRGFSDRNKGCRYEMKYLLNNIDIAKILFLVDDDTDMQLVRDTILSEWRTIDADSPNRAIKKPVVSFYKTGSEKDKDLPRIIGNLCNKLE